ncbi:MAG: SDR family oxidoreductase [Armatimonadaceae bacterium]
MEEDEMVSNMETNPGASSPTTTKSETPKKIRLKPLNEQVIVITGASSGIGLVTARAAAKAGAKVVVASRSEEAMRQLESELSQSGQALGVVCDVSDEAQVQHLAQRAIERFGGFDTWVNNAGVSIYGTFEEVKCEDMRQLFETNFWGVVHGSLTAVEHLKSHPTGGAIINIGSALSERAIPLQGTYTASKFAVRGFTDSLRMEIEKAGYPISLTLIKPAAIDTPYTSHAKNYMSDFPENPPPVYAPEVVADTILHCATVPERDMFAGGAGAGFKWMESVMPKTTDKGMEATMFDIQHSGKPEEENGSSLYQPSPPMLRERGDYEGSVLQASPYTVAQMNRDVLSAAAVGAGLLATTVYFVSRAQSQNR